MPWLRKALVRVELVNRGQSEALDGTVILWPVAARGADLPSDAFAFDLFCDVRPALKGAFPARAPYAFVGVGRFASLDAHQPVEAVVDGFFENPDVDVGGQLVCGVISYFDKTGELWETTGFWAELTPAERARGVVAARRPSEG